MGKFYKYCMSYKEFPHIPGITFKPIKNDHLHDHYAMSSDKRVWSSSKGNWVVLPSFEFYDGSEVVRFQSKGIGSFVLGVKNLYRDLFGC